MLEDQRTGPARQVERAAGAPIHQGNKKKTGLCRAQRVQPKVCSHHEHRAAQFYWEMAFALKMLPALKLFIASQVVSL
jgi:hypothetical protein